MKLFSALKRSAGFTMIELLIVIAILGILAVAVLSAINPIEQINRGRDTGSRSDAEQIISAIDRFQAFQGYYPWTGGVGEDFSVGADGTPQPVTTAWSITLGGNPCAVLDRLGSEDTGDPLCTNTDELNLSFIQRISENSYNTLYIYNAGAIGSSTYVCFEPQSRAFRQEAITRCTDGVPADLTAIANQVCAGVGDNAGETNLNGNANVPMVCLP